LVKYINTERLDRHSAPTNRKGHSRQRHRLRGDVPLRESNTLSPTLPGKESTQLRQEKKVKINVKTDVMVAASPRPPELTRKERDQVAEKTKGNHERLYSG